MSPNQQPLFLLGGDPFGVSAFPFGWPGKPL